MKKILFIIVLLTGFATEIIYAQEYQYVSMPTKNAIWSTYLYFPSAPIPIMNPIFSLFNEDTIIRNKIWYKLYQSADTIPEKENSILIGYIREENKKVYFKYKRDVHDPGYDNHILYDFTKNIGDTVVVDFDIRTELIITQIDTVVIGNKKRKQFKFNISEDLDNLYWIEGIGSTNGLLHSGDFVVGTHNFLLCFKKSGETFYYNNMFKTCYPDYPKIYYSIKDNKNNKALKVIPNPASKDCSIYLPEPITGKLTIYSLTGKIVLTKQINRIKTINISVKNIKQGMYILKIINTKNNKIYSSKIIKN